MTSAIPVNLNLNFGTNYFKSDFSIIWGRSKISSMRLNETINSK